MADKTEEKEVVETSTETPVESSAENEVADATETSADYGMVLDAIKRIEDNQTRLEGQINKLTDAQSLMVDVGAIIHDNTDPIEEASGVDEYIPIEELDLSL